MAFTELFFETLLQALGSNVFVFILAMIVFTAILVIGKHSLSSAMLLSVIFLDGLDRVANEPLMSLLYLSLKIIMFGLIGVSIVSWVRK